MVLSVLCVCLMCKIYIGDIENDIIVCHECVMLVIYFFSLKDKFNKDKEDFFL